MAYVTDLDSHYQPSLVKGLDFTLLNALLPEGRGWERRDARKRHEDLFGDEVLPGQSYYVRQVDAGFGSVLKLSQPSMDRLLAALFFSSGGLEQVAASETQRRDAALKATMIAAVNADQGK